MIYVNITFNSMTQILDWGASIGQNFVSFYRKEIPSKYS